MSAISGATWVAWRNNRAQAAVAGLLAAATAATLIVVALTASPRTGMALHLTWIRVALAVAPAVAGVFFGAPLLAADFERGTCRLAWTQGVTRRRWAAAHLGLLMGLSLLAAAVIAVAAQIWIAHIPADSVPNTTWVLYDVQGPMVFATVLFGIALGAAAGAVLRRTVPAMGVTLALFIALRVCFATLARPHLLPTATRLVSEFKDGGIPQSAGFVETTFLDSRLRPLPPDSGFGPYTPFRIVYQPASHFWPMQVMEAGFFIILAALLVYAAYRFATRDG
jgi:hypothetical protein